jgi:plasmid stability protein
MATLTIRNLPDETRDALRVRAARHGRSMEAEVRQVLIESATSEMRLAKGPTEEQRAAMRALQARVRTVVPPGVSLVDELIAERRAEQAAEDANP